MSQLCRRWDGPAKANGELLILAKDGADVFVTADQNLRYQQSLTEGDVPIIVFAASTNRLLDLIPLVPSALAAIERIRPGNVVIIAN